MTHAVGVIRNSSAYEKGHAPKNATATWIIPVTSMPSAHDLTADLTSSVTRKVANMGMRKYGVSWATVIMARRVVEPADSSPAACAARTSRPARYTTAIPTKSGRLRNALPFRRRVSRNNATNPRKTYA